MYRGTNLWVSVTFLLQYSSVGIKKIVELNGISPWIYNGRTVGQRIVETVLYSPFQDTTHIEYNNNSMAHSEWRGGISIYRRPCSVSLRAERVIYRYIQ